MQLLFVCLSATVNVGDMVLCRYLCDNKGSPVKLDDSSMDTCPEDIKHLITDCLNRDANLRPTFTGILLDCQN